jgi:hypothetical protein
MLIITRTTGGLGTGAMQAKPNVYRSKARNSVPDRPNKTGEHKSFFDCITKNHKAPHTLAGTNLTNREKENYIF